MQTIPNLIASSHVPSYIYVCVVCWCVCACVLGRSLHDSRRKGTSFEVHLWYFPGSGNCAADLSGKPVLTRDQSSSRPKENLKLTEDLHTHWNTWSFRQRVGCVHLQCTVHSAVACSDSDCLVVWRLRMHAYVDASQTAFNIPNCCWNCIEVLQN